VTAITCLFIIQEKEKKRDIKSRKIDKKKRKMFKSQHTMTVSPLLRFHFWRNLPLFPFPSHPTSL